MIKTLFRPDKQDFHLVLFNTGYVLLAFAVFTMGPAIVAGVIMKEYTAVVDLLIGLFVTVSIGFSFLIMFKSDNQNMEAVRHGMVIATVSWLLCTVLGAIPHYLSGHFLSYIDAVFDVMSGFTTTGLVLIQRLDFVSYTLNTYRHMLTYVGGQGMVLIALTFIAGHGGVVGMMIGEGKGESLQSNVVNTARVIWAISLWYLVIGTSIFWIAGWWEGLPFVEAFWHGFWLFTTNWSTGGFGAKSQNLMYYHSVLLEIVSLWIMLAGSFNFALHYSIWKGDKKEFWKNIEIRSMAVTLSIAVVIGTIGLCQTHSMNLVTTIRQIVHFSSAHTTTGVMSVYARQLISHFGLLFMIAVILAMAVGGSASSTAGGIKGIRIGILWKSFLLDIKRRISPPDVVTTGRFHHIKDQELSEDVYHEASSTVLQYCFFYFIATMVGVLYRYPFIEAMFDGVSALSNSGLSCGITAATMPVGMKILYFFLMWAGRLEFTALTATLGLGFSYCFGWRSKSV